MSTPTRHDASTRELIVREWIETQRLLLLDKLLWEQWHGWKTVSEPLIDRSELPFAAIDRRERQERRAA